MSILYLSLKLLEKVLKNAAKTRHLQYVILPLFGLNAPSLASNLGLICTVLTRTNGKVPPEQQQHFTNT